MFAGRIQAFKKMKVLFPREPIRAARRPNAEGRLPLPVVRVPLRCTPLAPLQRERVALEQGCPSDAAVWLLDQSAGDSDRPFVEWVGHPCLRGSEEGRKMSQE